MRALFFRVLVEWSGAFGLVGRCARGGTVLRCR
ncbi:hypothetical protein STSO111631_20910 [Stackebrandtia soli]